MPAPVTQPRNQARPNRPGFTNSGGYRVKDFFVYEIDFSSIAAGASQTASFIVQADSDFLWYAGAVHADLAAAAQTSSTIVIPLASVLITDTGSGRQLMNQAVPLVNIFGNGQLPFVLPRERIFVANSTVTVQVNNFSAASTYGLRLSFIGEKGFK